ncbi:HelD family protein [Adlercreutzia shanghongiae]|uniref:ATP-binding domain-containing protein n=1 Tax=Adlercreutzia shanghongiae TaxID=3111773 RepID=A0ABU6IYU5_9ACTN|nr:ATP-binding domain-containing protein [Adlercreutzia sp. R22]MEC4295020.1 ATP-binding domain-containing protein [Adlercreutzia sp. R22]
MEAQLTCDQAGNHPTTTIENEERSHLEEVLAAVRASVGRARDLAERAEASHREAGAQLAADRGELAPEEAHLSAFELNRMDAQAALAHRSHRRLEKLLASPYFARVDFAEEGGADSEAASDGRSLPEDQPQATYIGRFAFTWQNRALVSDWRSPVAALFYDFECGPAVFDAPGGRREGTLMLKRQIAVEDGRLRCALDSDSSVRDEVLAQALSRSSDAKMHDIVASIQHEQNAVIRDEAPGTLIIQGVAGSGKTSIALHRVAYLLYRQKGRLSSQSVAILSPSRVFSDYISGVLPELGEEPVRQWSLHDVASLLLEGIAKAAPPRSFADEADLARAERARVKGTEEFARQLASWLDEQLGEKVAGEGAPVADVGKAPSIFDPHDVAVGGDVAEAGWLAECFAAYAPVPFEERLDLIAGDALELAHGKTFGRYAHAMPTRREVRSRLLRMMRAKNPLALYRRFLADTGQSALLKMASKGVVEWEDAFPLALCAAAFLGSDGFAATAAVRHLVIDEMQDLPPVAHEAVGRLFRCDKTILGDVNQLVDGRPVAAPETVAAHYPGARVVHLITSYRSTCEITELASRVLPVAGLVPVQRHGEPPRFVRCGDTAGVLAAVEEAAARWEASEHRTLGIIAKSDFLAARYAELLGRGRPVTLLTDETAVYPGGIVVASVRLAKGLEFDEAVLLDVDGRQYASEVDRNLLYVAVTRAMHALTVLYRDEPSPFLR